ncbi:MAG: hypothetical protein M1347_00030 [Chloroflexi bacterium]|nr:hypothetical protein [Chloroflexota bacterium]
MLKAILRFFAVIVLAVFIIAFPLSLVLRNVGSLIFDPETTKTLVRESLSGSELISSLVFQASRQMLQGDEGEENSAIQLALGNLSGEDWNQITRLIAPKELVDNAADQVVDAFTAWLNTQTAFPDVQINLTAWKENALANAGEVVSVMLNALPACDEEALVSLAVTGQQDPEQLGAELLICLPPEPFYNEVVSRAELLMGQMLSQAPDTIDLGQLNQGQAPAELTQLKQNLVSLRTFLGWSWLAVLGVGAMGVVMGASGVHSFLRWAGWPLLLSGVIILVFGAGLQLFSLNFLDQFLAAMLEQGPGPMSSLGATIASGTLNLITRPLLIQGVLITTLGLIALIYARILAHRQASPGIPINRRRIGL